jgi:hypothetical protein
MCLNTVRSEGIFSAKTGVTAFAIIEARYWHPPFWPASSSQGGD